MTVILVALTAVALFFLQQVVYKRLWSKSLKVNINFKDKTLNEGDEGWLIQTVENAKRLPLPMCKVKFECNRALLFFDSGETSVSDKYYRDEAFTVSSYKRVVRELKFTAKERGFYSIDGFDVVGTDIFMSSQFVEHEDCHTEIYVYPVALERDLSEAAIRQLTGEMLSRRRFIEDPFEYVGVREYQPFDELKNINWKATAKTGDLKVNTHGYTARQGVRIFLNLKDDGVLKHRENVENSIRFAVRMCMEFIGSGDRVALFANIPDVITGKPLIIPAGTGESHMEAILRGLARLDTDKRHFDFAETFRDEVFEEKSDYMTVFVSTPSANDFDGFVREYHETGKDLRHFILCQEGDKYEANVENAVFTTVICMEKK